MKIVIDARFYGLENAGLGRYVINLISEISKINKSDQFLILLRKKYFDSLNFPKNFHKILFDANHYSFDEQLNLPKLLNNLKPDLVHFPHFNVPVFYTGKYITTIHDMLMHKQKGLSATTLNPFSYLIKRLAYKFAFFVAVKKSEKIIVPSKSVKFDLIKYYKLDENKLEVIYEG